jgi:MFS transporter, PAT family, beta-lactamase induction signal transducer AmpG
MNDSPLKKPSVWCFTTYFAEGFPFGIVRMMSSVFFTDIGMKERYLGYLNFLGIPWNLKFLWAPFVDILASKRGWLIAAQLCVTVLTLAVSGLCFYAGHDHVPGILTPVLVGLFIALAFVSATNDIAIDGFYMEGIPDAKQQAAYTGYRVFAYRIALVLAKFGIIYTVGSLAKSSSGSGMYNAWGFGFGAAACTMGLFTAYHFFFLPVVEIKKAARGVGSAAQDFLNSFASYLDISNRRASITLKCGLLGAAGIGTVFLLVRHDPIQALATGMIVMLAALLLGARPAVALSLVFIIVYRIGDEIIFSMGTPFLKRYLLVSNIQLAWMAGLVGLFGAIAGTAIGGLWIKKSGLKKTIWPLTLLMNLNIWAYIWIAWQRPLATTIPGLLTIGAVYCYEQIASGLGNAVLIVFILRTCKKEFKAGHYAIGSAFMSVFSTVFGGFGGVIVERAGYLNLFLIGFFATIPVMALMFFVKIKEE